MADKTDQAGVGEHVMLPVGIKKVAAKNHGHYAIAGVLVFPAGEPDKVYAAATNGHMAIIYEARGYLTGKSILPAGIMAGSGNTPQQFTLDREPDTWSVDAKGGTMSGAPMDGNFPRIGDIMPQAGEKDFVFAVNAQMLADLAAAMGSRDHEVTLRISSPNKPICVMGTEPGVMGVIMPCGPQDAGVWNAAADGIQGV